MRPQHVCRLLAVSLLALCSGLPVAWARVEASSEYSKTQTFSAALRFLRVDRGYEVLEKDADAAYLLFQYPLPGKGQSATGSVEVVETTAGVKVYVRLPRLPAYQEAMLRDGLLQKLRDDYGAPPVKAPAKPVTEPKTSSESRRPTP